MKQHITIEQLNELSEEGKDTLRNWWLTENGNVFVFFSRDLNKWYEGVIDEEHWEKEVHYPSGKREKAYPLLSIGQMIEFLREKSMGDLDLQIWINSAGSSVWLGIGKQENKLAGGEDMEIRDALWEAVKEILDNKV